jgi:hypothetical protein
MQATYCKDIGLNGYHAASLAAFQWNPEISHFLARKVILAHKIRYMIYDIYLIGAQYAKERCSSRSYFFEIYRLAQSPFGLEFILCLPGFFRGLPNRPGPNTIEFVSGKCSQAYNHQNSYTQPYSEIFGCGAPRAWPLDGFI